MRFANNTRLRELCIFALWAFLLVNGFWYGEYYSRLLISVCIVALTVLHFILCSVFFYEASFIETRAPSKVATKLVALSLTEFNIGNVVMIITLVSLLANGAVLLGVLYFSSVFLSDVASAVAKLKLGKRTDAEVTLTLVAGPGYRQKKD